MVPNHQPDIDLYGFTWIYPPVMGLEWCGLTTNHQPDQVSYIPSLGGLLLECAPETQINIFMDLSTYG